MGEKISFLDRFGNDIYCLGFCMGLLILMAAAGYVGFGLGELNKSSNICEMEVSGSVDFNISDLPKQIKSLRIDKIKITIPCQDYSKESYIIDTLRRPFYDR